MIKTILIIILLGIVISIFLPILVLLILGTIQSKIKNKKLKLAINRPYKLFFGFGNISDDGCYMQREDFDCGVVCAENALYKMHFQKEVLEEARYKLKAPVHIEQFINYFTNLSLKVTVIKNCDENFLYNYINSGNCLIVLMKITYVFRAKWNYATFLFFRYYIKLNSGHHWVLVDHIDEDKVYILDPSFGRIVMKVQDFVSEISEVGLLLEREKDGLS